MMGRCGHSNPDLAVAGYAGRGIRVCPEWHDFIEFQKWALNNGYHASKSIDRIDNDGGYQPDNCRWATSRQQNNNRRNCHALPIAGQTYTIAEASRKFGASQPSIARRLKDGWPPEDAVKKLTKGQSQAYQRELLLAA